MLLLLRAELGCDGKEDEERGREAAEHCVGEVHCIVGLGAYEASPS